MNINCNAKVGSKVRILVDDEPSFNRFKKGDVGVILKHGEKEHAEYEHCVSVSDIASLGNNVSMTFYFMKNEVEFIK